MVSENKTYNIKLTFIHGPATKAFKVSYTYLSKTYQTHLTFIRGQANKTDAEVPTLNTAGGDDGDSFEFRGVGGALMQYLRLINV